MHADLPGVPPFLELNAHGFRPRLERRRAFVEGKNSGVIAAGRGRDGVLHGDGRFPRAGRTHEQRARAAIRAAAQERVQRGDAALDSPARERFAMFGRNEAGEDL